MILMVTLPIVAHAQDEEYLVNKMPDISVTSPLSSQFNRFEFYPVSKATGVVDISIPLFSIPMPDGGSLPFSIAYHASGIKVEDPVGILGYGWSLLPGLRVTRKSFGKIDEMCKPEKIPDNPYLIHPDSVAYWASPTTDFEWSWGYDGEHDIFTVNTLSGSCSFIIETKANGYSVRQIKQSPLRIEVIGLKHRPIVGFKVTDTNGVVYWYGDRVNEPRNFVVCTITENPLDVAYVLRKITYPTGQEILFHYKPVTIKSFARYHNATFVKAELSFDFEHKSISEFQHVENYRMSYDKGLTSIEFPLGRVEFSYNNNPSRVEMLKQIKVLNKDAKVIRRVDFYSDLTTDLLDSVSVTGDGTYRFSYNTQSFENVYAQDKFGYYTGEVNAGINNLFPRYIVQLLDSIQSVGCGDGHSEESAMKAKILEKIVYPTGGYATFEYEMNRALSVSEMTGDWTDITCGLRIKRLSQYDPSSGQEITKSYKYGSNESGYGNIIVDTSDWGYVSERIQKVINIVDPIENPEGSGEPSVLDAHWVIVSEKNANITLFNDNCMVWYDEVAEYTSTGGKTVERYDYLYDQSNASGNKAIYWSALIDTPHLIDRKIYKGDRLQEHTIYKYADNNQYIQGILVNTKTLFVGRTGKCGSGHNVYCFSKAAFTDIFKPSVLYENTSSSQQIDYEVIAYPIYVGLQHLDWTITKRYDDSGETFFETAELYTYDDRERLFNVREKRVYTSEGDSVASRYYYSSDNYAGYPQLVREAMEVGNCITSPIVREYVKYKGDIEYDKIYTEQILYGKVNNDTSVVRPVSYFYRDGGNNAFEKQSDYTYYDSGKLKSKTGLDNLTTIYLWGYSYQYPVAEIKNASWEQVESIIGDAEAFAAAEIPDGMLLARLRTELPSAQVTVYTYEPLVGITSSTDPRGHTTYYEYDDAGRLVRVKEGEKTTTLYKYHYRNE